MCPCCGFNGLDEPAYAKAVQPSLVRGLSPPYEKHFGRPSYDVCSCCGFEYGNDDNPGTAPPVSFESYLAEWVEDGSRWFDEEQRPESWTLESQLREATDDSKS